MRKTGFFFVNTEGVLLEKLLIICSKEVAQNLKGYYNEIKLIYLSVIPQIWLEICNPKRA